MLCIQSLSLFRFNAKFRDMDILNTHPLTCLLQNSLREAILHTKCILSDITQHMHIIGYKLTKIRFQGEALIAYRKEHRFYSNISVLLNFHFCQFFLVKQLFLYHTIDCCIRPFAICIGYQFVLVHLPEIIIKFIDDFSVKHI